MKTLAELKVKADNLGIDRGIVRLYGDLRKIETWERAITSHQTVTVEAVEIADTVADEIDKNEIIPFIPEVDLADCNDRKSTMLFEVQRQRAIFEKKPEAIANIPPAPPPIIINVPAERRDIPPNIPDRLPDEQNIEIAERESPSPGHGRGDERFRNIVSNTQRPIERMVSCIYAPPKETETSKSLSEQLLDQCKSDIQRYFEWMKEDTEYCFEVNYLDEKLNNSLNELIDFLSSDISKKTSIYDIWATVPHFKREGFNKLIPFALHEIYTGNPPIGYWECTRETVWLLIEKPAPIPLLAEDFGGVFVPNKLHELGMYKYLWKFPGAIQCENFFHNITNAREYAVIPANQCIQAIQQPKQLLLAGV